METKVMFPTLDRAAVLMLLASEADRMVSRRRPDDSEPPEAQARFAKAVKRTISKVSCQIHKGGLTELRKYYRHAAFRHSPPLRSWIARAYAVCKKSGDRRALVYSVLLLRDQVRHYWDFNGRKAKDDRFPLPSAREAERMRKRVWRKNAEGEYESSIELGDAVKPSDGGKTPFLNVFDTQGWDKPTSFPTKSTRMAFCGVCADAGLSPWWRVRRRTTKDGYEQAPFQLRELCPICGWVESAPRPATSTRIFIHRRIVKRHRTQHFEYTVFYRSHGRWTWASDHARCHADLHYALERRWWQLRSLRITK